MSEGKFQTKNGEEAVQGEDGGWYQPTVNPFGHGCCDCGLFHQVEIALIDEEGNQIPFPEGTAVALRFTRDEIETRRLWEHRGK
jgi:hypothetical protein